MMRQVKKIIGILLSLAIVCQVFYGFPVSADAQVRKVLLFEDFESAAYGNTVPSGWIAMNPANTTIEIVEDSVSGKALKLSGTAANGGVTRYFYGDFAAGKEKMEIGANLRGKLTTGLAYIIVTFAKDDGKGGYLYNGEDSGGRFSPNAPHAWDFVGKKYDIPTGTTRIQVAVRMAGPTAGGEIYWDDLSIKADMNVKGREVLIGGDFEQGAAGTKIPPEWIKYSEATTNIEIVEDSIKGGKVLHLSGDGAIGGVYQDIKGDFMGKDIVVSARLRIEALLDKGAAKGAAVMNAEFFDTNGSFINAPSQMKSFSTIKPGEWQTIEEVIKTPPETARVRLYFRFWGGAAGGEIYWDDLSAIADITVKEIKADVDMLTPILAKHGIEDAEREELLALDENYLIPMTAGDFTDVTTGTAIEALGDIGIVKAREGDKYFPDANLTGDEMGTILFHAFGNGAPDMSGISGIEDVTYEQAVKMLLAALGYESDAQSQDYIAKAEQRGMLTGTDEEKTNPSAPITRGVIATLINNCIDISHYGVKGYDTKNQIVHLKNAPDGLKQIKIDPATVVIDHEGKALRAQECHEWDSISIVKDKNGKIIRYIRTQYTGGDWSLTNNAAYEWVQKEKIRMVYGSVFELDRLDKEGDVLTPSADAGINLFALNINPEVGKDFDDYAKTLDKIVQMSKDRNMKFFVKLNFGDNSFFSNTAFGEYHTGSKTEYTRTPCPLSETYWEKQLIQKFAMVADRPEILGVVYDMEMYTADTSSYPGACFCDTCWSKFINDRNYAEIANTPASERVKAVAEKNILDEYNEWFEHEIAKLTRKTEKLLHAINPNLILSYMPSFEWLKGISRGLGTPEMPVLVLSEREYWGSLADTTINLEKIKDESYPAVYLVGLWNDPLSPSKFQDMIGKAGTLDAGYWVYAAQYFRADQKRQYIHKEDYTPAAYFNAMKNGNERLDEIIKNGEKVDIPKEEVFSYTAGRISGEPTEADWENAPYTEDFAVYTTGVKSDIKTRAQILHNGKSLFIRVENSESSMDKLAIAGTKRDVYGPDCNEFFWKFDDAPAAVHAAVNRAGGIYDALSTGIGSENATVNFEGIKAASQDFADKWVSVTELPLTIDETRHAKPGETLRLEIARYRPLSAENEENKDGGVRSTCWAVTYGTYLGSQSLWGKVVLSETPNPVQPIICTVAFDSSGGSATAPVNVASGSAITAPAAPTKEGYIFTGWFKETALENAWNFEEDKVTSDITLYAKWTKNAEEPGQEQNRILVGITTPAAITGVANGTAKTAEALGLPETVLLETTTGGAIGANVTWDVTSAAYDPAAKTTQTFIVEGIVTLLPERVVNPDGIPLTVSISVTVNGAVTPEPTYPETTPTPPTTLVPEKQVEDGQVTTTILAKPTVDANGKAVAEISQTRLADALAKAATEAAKQGTEVETTIKIEVSADARARTVGISLTDAALKEFAESRADALVLSTPLGTMTFDKKVAETILAQSAGALTFTVTKGGPTELTAEIRSKVGDRPVVSFDVTSKDKAIVQLGGKTGVTISYVLKAGENPNAIVVYTINAAKKPEIIPSCNYDPATGTLTFKMENTSKFAVAYNKVDFGDAAKGAWYYEAVTFAAAREITAGIGKGNFGSNNAVTRAQALVMMMKAFGITPNKNAEDNFSDAGDTYYTGYLAAAKKLGITSGVGGNKFAPDRQVTRQELFVLVYNILKNMNELPDANTAKYLADFKDAERVAGYANDAIELFVKAGIISGSGGNILPENPASRAQFVQILYNVLIQR